MTHETQDLQRQLAEAQDHALWLQQQHEQQLRSATKQQTKHQALLIAYQKIIDALQEDKAQLLFEKDQLLEDKAVLLGDIRMWEDESLEKDSQLAEYKQVIADLQFDSSQLQADKTSVLKDLHLQEKELAARESEVTECQQFVTRLQRVLSDKCLPPAYPMAVKAKPWTVPCLNKQIAELRQQLGDLQERFEELQQQSSVQDGRVKEAFDEIAQTEAQISTLHTTVTKLQNENMRLETHCQSVLHVNQQLKDQVEDLQTQLKKLQGTNLLLEQTVETQLANSKKVVSDLQAALAAGAEACDELASKQMELIALSSTVINLEQQNLQLGAQKQCLLDTNHQLQDQVADVHGHLQRLQGMITDFDEQRANYQQKASEVSLLVLMVINLQQQNLRLAAQRRTALRSTVIHLEQQNLQLGGQNQCVLATNHQLQDQVSDLQGQLQHLQGMVTDSEVQQLLVDSDSNTDDADAPATPELVAGSFNEVDGRRLQSDPPHSSNSTQVSATSLATTVSPGSRGNRGIRAGRAVVAAAAAGVLLLMTRREIVRI